jgi:hypothetical protein
MRERSFVAGLIFVEFLMASGLGLSQTAQQSGTLAVSGHSGEAPVIQAGGRSYVDVEALARLTNGSLSFNGNQVTLTLHGSGRGAKPKAPQTTQTAPAPGFSKDFLKAGIEAMAEIREWRSALESAVQYGFPPGDNWISSYSGAAATGISLASAAASTDDDRKAFQYLSNEFNSMQQLSGQMLSRRKSLNYIPPDALKNDPLDQKILACARSLGAMAAAGQFQDASSCH